MIEIKFTGEGDQVAYEITRFAAQLGTGIKVIDAANRQRAEAAESANAEGEGPKTEPAPEQPKATESKRGRKLKAEQPAPEPAPAEQPKDEPLAAEDVFAEDDEPVAEEVSVPKDKEGMKAAIIGSGLTPEKQLELLKKFSPTGKLSGVPIEDYGKVVKWIDEAVAAQKVKS